LISQIPKVDLPELQRSPDAGPCAAFRGVMRCQGRGVERFVRSRLWRCIVKRRCTRPDTTARLARDRTRHCADGYRFAKRQGKPNSANLAVAQQNNRFCDFATCAAPDPFRFDSSRTLNCSSNLIGHDHPTSRQTAVGNNRAFNDRTGAALGTGRQE
jgi:hypothetical protein